MEEYLSLLIPSLVMALYVIMIIGMIGGCAPFDSCIWLLLVAGIAFRLYG